MQRLVLLKKKVWSRFVYLKRGSDKTREKINGNNPHTRIDCVEYTKPNTGDGVVVFTLSLMETVRFLLKDSAKTLSPNMYVSGHLVLRRHKLTKLFSDWQHLRDCFIIIYVVVWRKLYNEYDKSLNVLCQSVHCVKSMDNLAGIVVCKMLIMS